MAVLDKVLVAVVLLHIIICPFTKVEESFNIQAMHDILYHGNDLDKYDHHEFPGVVPRTFLGPLAISAAAYPFILVVKFCDLSKFFSQYIVRSCLGLAVCYSLLQYKTVVSKQFGKGTGKWFLLVTMSQFHLLFYASRPLPNIFALVTALSAIQWWLTNRPGMFLLAAGCGVIVFRAELCLLLGLYLLSDLWTGRLTIRRLILYAGPIAALWIGLTVLVDSFFWRRWLWPEGEVLWYNTVLNKSSDWGTSPFLWYFYSALPRAMSSSLFLIPLGVFVDTRTARVAGPAVLFVFLYSFLPHKELRFIIYVIPLLNTPVAAACNRLWCNRAQPFYQYFLCMLAAGHLIINLASTAGFVYLSRINYPGGEAMLNLHKLEALTQDVHVHIDVTTAQTGVSRFTQSFDHWRYSKDEDLPPGGDEMLGYTHLFIGSSSILSPELQIYSKTHQVLNVTNGFSRIEFRRREFPPVQVVSEPRIFLLKKLHIDAV